MLKSRTSQLSIAVRPGVTFAVDRMLKSRTSQLSIAVVRLELTMGV